MSQQLKTPLNDSDVDSSNTKKINNKAEVTDPNSSSEAALLSKEDDGEFDDQLERSYSISSMADGNRRINKQNASKDTHFYRFPEPKTLLFRDTNIGLYSPLVSTRRTGLLAKSLTNTTSTIYDGVPTYLNPNIMRQRQNRSKSQYANDNNNNNNNKSTTFTRSQSTKVYRKDEENKNILKNDFEIKPIESNLSKQLNNKKGFFVDKNDKMKGRHHVFGSFSYQELDDNNINRDINRDRDRDRDRDRYDTEWSLIDHDEAPHRKLSHEEQMTVSYVKTASKKRLLYDFNTIWKRAYFALIILAIFNGMLTFCISKAASQVWLLESWIYEYEHFQIAHGAPAYLLQLIIKLTLILGAICLTRSFAPGCAGSGVPELRAILSGIWIRHYLSKTTFFIKICALTLSLSSGAPIGLEGPFIHLSSIIARQLTKLKVFAHLDRKQMLSAACAGGLASVFGAPIGGVLFSIEVTSTYYPVTNYWTAFCCAMVGSTMTHIFQQLSPTSLLLYQTSFSDADQPLPREFPYFAFLGLFAGFSGMFFIYFHDFYVDLRRKYQSRFFGDNPYGIAVVVIVLFTTILFFIGDFAIEPARKAVSDMFNIEYLSNCDDSIMLAENLECNMCDCVNSILKEEPTLCDSNSITTNKNIICQQHDWCHCHYHDWILNSGLYANLSAFYILNFFFTICTVTLSFPCGIFSPIFTLGSVFGRIYGELFRHWFNYCDPRVYSVVGAASMASAVTQTISPAVIALEITQDLSLAVPCLLAVIVSGGISRSLIHSFYDSILQLRGIPMLPLRPTIAYKRVFIKKKKQSLESIQSMDYNNINNIRMDVDNKPEILVKNINSNQAMYRLLIADDVMCKEFSFVTIDPNSNELINVLTNNFDQEWFPIVHTISESVLVGEARRSVLMDLLQKIDSNAYENDIPQQLKIQHLSFYDQSVTQLTDKASLTNDTLLLNETMPSINNRNKTSQTFRNKLTNLKWRQKKDINKQEPLELDNMDKENHINDNNIDSDSSDQNIKITLMSSGFIERINLSPIQVISEMPLTKIYTLFHILKPQNVYVTKYSRLIGVINEVQLLKREFETQHTSKKARMYCLRCNKVCRDCTHC